MERNPPAGESIHPDLLQCTNTADGSKTIYHSGLREHYHSIHGAVQESRHVFVNSGLLYFLDKNPPIYKVSPTGGDLEGASVSILEVGFGTGLNFLLSADVCTAKYTDLEYTGIEAYPLSGEMIRHTGYDQYVSADLWQKFTDNYDELLSSPVTLNPRCKLQVANSKLSDFQSAKQYDIIYFDAFAVAHQPEMWDETAMAHTLQFLKAGGVFVTYAITGNLKRALKTLGCKVEKAPGAPGKREMLRAVKIT